MKRKEEKVGKYRDGKCKKEIQVWKQNLMKARGSALMMVLLSIMNTHSLNEPVYIGRSGIIKMFILLCKVMVWNISIIELKNTETLIEKIELSD